MKTTSVVLFLLCINPLFSQQRLGLDLGMKFFGVNANVYYQNAIFKNFLFSTGFAFGNYGKNYISYHLAGVESGLLKLPFTGRSNQFQDTSGILDLLTYSTQNRAIGITIGFGYFKEFSINHGIRFYLNSKFFYANGRETMTFGSESNGIKISYKSNIYVACLSPELVHTIRLNTKMTFLYGIKVPYYFSLDKGKYNPQYSKDTFYKIEPELTIGLTRIIGKCD